MKKQPYTLPPEIAIEIRNDYVWVSDCPDDPSIEEEIGFDSAIEEYLSLCAKDGKAVLISDWYPAPGGGYEALRAISGYPDVESIPF